MTTIAYSINMDELVFAGKNKSYGAYLLRKLYKKNISIAFFIAVLLFIAGTSAPLILNRADRSAHVKPRIPIGVTVDIERISEVKPDLNTQEAFRNLPPVRDMVKFTVPIVTPDNMVNNESYMPTIDDLSKADPGYKTEKGIAGGLDPTLITDYIPMPVPEEKIVEKTNDAVFITAEEMPMYPGGDEALMEFIGKSLVYPEMAIKAEVEGRVSVEFIVEKTGEVTNVKVLKSIGAGCDEEAVRVCRMLRKWNPGKQNGVPVRVRVVIPFVFRLN